MEKTLRSFYGGSNADLGPVNMDSPPQINDYLRWTGAYWAPASFEEPEKNLTETVRNAGFTMLPKGTPVKIVGNTGQEANVIAANATDSFPAHLILNQDLLAGATGEAVAIGFINNVPVPNASLFSGGQEVYLGPTGGWTTTRPTGTNKIQKLGIIVKPNTGANTVSGIIDIANIQDLPNLAQGKVWIGGTGGVPEEATLSWSIIISTPTTLSGYGITDGLPLAGGTLTGLLQVPSFQLNGVTVIANAVKPTVRSDGSALVARDSWYNTTNGTWWFWNGTYWVSPLISTHSKAYVNPGSLVISNGQTFFSQSVIVAVLSSHNTSILFENITGYIQGSPVFSGTLNSSNFLTPQLAGLGSINLNKLDTLTLLSPSTPYVLLNTPTVHTISTADAGTTLAAGIIHNVTGTPSLSWTHGFNWAVLTRYREIAP